MAHLHLNQPNSKLDALRGYTRQAEHVHHAQIMLVAAGMTAVGIVAVAATVMTTLL